MYDLVTNENLDAFLAARGKEMTMYVNQDRRLVVPSLGICRRIYMRALIPAFRIGEFNTIWTSAVGGDMWVGSRNWSMQMTCTGQIKEMHAPVP